MDLFGHLLDGFGILEGLAVSKIVVTANTGYSRLVDSSCYVHGYDPRSSTTCGVLASRWFQVVRPTGHGAGIAPATVAHVTVSGHQSEIGATCYAPCRWGLELDIDLTLSWWRSWSLLLFLQLYGGLLNVF